MTGSGPAGAWHGKSLLYYNREEMLHGASEENFYEPAAAPRPAAHAHTHATPAPPSAPPSAVPPARSFAQKHEHKQAQKQAARVDAKPKPKERTRVDRNSLSACGSSVTFSDAAIAAQARADAAKDRNEPEKKRPRRANAQPAHVPSPPAHEPGPRGRVSVRAPDVSEEDAQQLETVAARNGVPVPTTSEQAEIFMQAIMGIRLWESDGSGERPRRDRGRGRRLQYPQRRQLRRLRRTSTAWRSRSVRAGQGRVAGGAGEQGQAWALVILMLNFYLTTAAP